MPELPGISLDQLPAPRAASGQLGNAPTSVGFQTEPIGNFAMPGPGQFVPPSSAFEGQDWFGIGTGAGLLFRSLNNATAREMAAGADVFGTGEPSPPEPTLLPDAANEKYGIPRKLSFSAPVPESVAQSMLTAKQAEIAREDAAARTPPGFWPNAARLGASFVAGLTDPLNAAAMFIPGVGEERFAGLFGETLAGRIAARGAAGAVSGAAIQAPLVGLRYGLSGGEQADYDSYQALIDLASGAGLGALFHVGGGALGDALTGRVARTAAARVVADQPEVRSAALQSALAASVEDRPVDVAPVMDAALERHGAQTKPVSLLSFLVENGGVQDQGGDLGAMDARLGRPGLVSAKGMALDYAREKAEEAGYLPPNSTVADLLSAVSEELSGRKVYTGGDVGAAYQLEQARRGGVENERYQEHSDMIQAMAREAGVVLTAEDLDHATQLSMGGTYPDEALYETVHASDMDRSEQLDHAVRAATEPRPVPQVAEAQAATQVKPDALLREADQTIADHQAFFQEAEAAGALTDEHRAELEQIAELPKEAGAIRQAFMTAAACIARGFV